MTTDRYEKCNFFLYFYENLMYPVFFIAENDFEMVIEPVT